MNNNDIFLRVALSQVPRILGFLDTDYKSKTYGCLDRNYWHYKIIDFPNIRFQEAALVLSLIYNLRSNENRFYKLDKIREWLLAATAFWFKNRHRDGSADESYPFERHFCATAFSCYAITESLLLLGVKTEFGVENTGNFLIRRNNKDVANQMACTALALHNLYVITGGQKYKMGFENKLKSLFGMQAKEGFFTEYGSFDLGYDSITLSFLGEIYKKTRREDVKNSAMLCIRNMDRFIDDDGYFNPETMSRKTQFLYSYGFAVFNSDILKRIKAGLEKSVILNPAWMDDRYCIPFTANYLMTAIEEGAP